MILSPYNGKIPCRRGDMVFSNKRNSRLIVSVKQDVTYHSDKSQATITPRAHENPQVVIHDEVEGLYEHKEYSSRVPAGALGTDYAGAGG